MSRRGIAGGGCASEQSGVPSNHISQFDLEGSDRLYTFVLAIELEIDPPDLQAWKARSREPAKLVLASIKYV